MHREYGIYRFPQKRRKPTFVSRTKAKAEKVILKIAIFWGETCGQFRIAFSSLGIAISGVKVWPWSRLIRKTTDVIPRRFKPSGASKTYSWQPRPTPLGISERNGISMGQEGRLVNFCRISFMRLSLASSRAFPKSDFSTFEK